MATRLAIINSKMKAMDALKAHTSLVSTTVRYFQ